MQDIWDKEELFWLGDESFYQENLSEKCLMVFPNPVGILERADIVDALKQAPRWDNVNFLEKRSIKNESIVLLAYYAEGKRQGKGDYKAYCSSTYHLQRGFWKMVCHQQTPISS